LALVVQLEAETEGGSPMARLPDELLLHILGFVERQWLFRAAFVCRRWLRLAADPALYAAPALAAEHRSTGYGDGDAAGTGNGTGNEVCAPELVSRLDPATHAQLVRTLPLPIAATLDELFSLLVNGGDPFSDAAHRHNTAAGEASSPTTASLSNAVSATAHPATSSSGTTASPVHYSLENYHTYRCTFLTAHRSFISCVQLFGRLAACFAEARGHDDQRRHLVLELMGEWVHLSGFPVFEMQATLALLHFLRTTAAAFNRVRALSLYAVVLHEVFAEQRGAGAAGAAGGGGAHLRGFSTGAAGGWVGGVDSADAIASSASHSYSTSAATATTSTTSTSTTPATATTATATATATTAAAAAAATTATSITAASAQVDQPSDYPSGEVKLPKQLSVELAWTDVDPEEVARQMTLLDHQFYAAIRACELAARSWKFTWTRHVRANVRRFAAVGTWLSTQLMREGSLKARAKLYGRIVQLAWHLRELNNLAGMWAVVSGLQTSSVRRLHRTLALVPKRHRDLLQRLTEQMDSSRGFRSYFEHYGACARPRVPYMGVYLAELNFVGDFPDLFLPGPLVHFAKARKTYLIVANFLDSQSHPYPFVPIPRIRYLLCNLAPLMPIKQQYRLSLQIEPRRQ
jgi:RasGEF domain/F-box-like